MKILIVRFSSIGDIVLTSPVLRVVRNAFPDAEIHFLTRKRFVSLMEFNPRIDRIHVLEPGLSDCIGRLRNEHFDLVLDLHRNLRTYLLGLGLNCPVYAFPKMNLAKLRMVFFKDRRIAVSHVAGRYMQPAVQALGVKPDNLGLEYFPCECEKPVWPSGFDPEQPFVVFALGGTHPTKRMPAEKWCGFFPLIRNCSLVLVGGKDEDPAAQIIENEAQRSGLRVWNACGRMSPGGSAWVIREARLVFSHDTGMMHIAAAFRRPVVAIWGNTVPAFGMWPYQTAHFNMEVENLGCRPCSRIGYPSCPKGHFNCMQKQDTGSPALRQFVESQLL